MDKDFLRRETLKNLGLFEHKKEESEFIVRMILNSEEWKNAVTVLAFCPLSTEPDISPILRDPRILLPYIENGEMHFGIARNLRKSKLGFIEPDHEEAPYSHALMLSPLVGYNDKLARLGRGGGYYDRYISKNRDRLTVWGVAFSPSYIPNLVAEPHDAVLDGVFTLKNENPRFSRG